MTTRTFYVVTYDVPDDKRRTQIAKVLEGYGSRVNYSVFECVLTERQYAALRRKLDRRSKPEEDQLRYYALCADCSRRIDVVGTTPVTTYQEIVIV